MLNSQFSFYFLCGGTGTYTFVLTSAFGCKFCSEQLATQGSSHLCQHYDKMVTTNDAFTTSEAVLH